MSNNSGHNNEKASQISRTKITKTNNKIISTVTTKATEKPAIQPTSKEISFVVIRHIAWSRLFAIGICWLTGAIDFA